jgi:hypothetical protein
MTREEYFKLFHNAQVNLVAFKPVFHCDEELQKMVEMAVEAEREACAKVCEDGGKDESGRIHVQAWGCAKDIRARGNHGNL